MGSRRGNGPRVWASLTRDCITPCLGKRVFCSFSVRSSTGKLTRSFLLPNRVSPADVCSPKMERFTMTLRVTLIQGGEIGHDLVPAVKRVVEAAGVAIAWEEHVAGFEAIRQGLDPLPAPMLESVRRNGLALKTKLMPDPKRPTMNYNVALRRALNLFATVRPLKNIRGL